MAQSVFDKNELYRLLQEIPCGRVTTYGVLARRLGNVRLARAVGNALHKNEDGSKFPCYKVVNSRGELSVAYKFGGIKAQKERLEADGIVVNDCRVDLEKYLWI
ncbi:MAG: MGMT family protein [Clostridiales bacterium]|nr:MGMT family protein [Clostridiales bacterium]